MTLVKETSTAVQEPLREQSYGAVRSPDRLSLGQAIFRSPEDYRGYRPASPSCLGPDRVGRWGTEEMTELKLREAGAARRGADV